MDKTKRTIFTISALIFTGVLVYFLITNYVPKKVPAPSERTQQPVNQPENKEDSISDQPEDEEGLPKASNEMVIVDQPRVNENVTSPLSVIGKARGSWYFEGTFNIVLTDWDGRIIAEAQAQAQDEWTTEDFVPFEAELTFEKPELYDRGSLILQKANPSDLPENDAALEFTVYFE